MKFYIRIGKRRGTGPYVNSYAGGDITTTRRRSEALCWSDRGLVHLLARVIREVDGRHARVVRLGGRVRPICRDPMCPSCDRRGH